MQAASPLRLELTVPCGEQSRELLGAVSRRMAAYMGYADADAAAVADTVLQATGGLLTPDAPPEYTSLDLTFSAHGQDMEITLRYRRRDPGAAAGRSAIRQRLCRPGADGAAVDAMRHVMTGVEFGCRDGVEFCCLTRRLPDSPA